MSGSGHSWKRAFWAFLAGASLFAADTAAAETRFDCVIDPSFRASLGSPVSGLLEEVFVSRGDWVDEGAPIARLTGRVEALTVALLRERAQSRARIESREARLRLAGQALERVRQLNEQNITSDQVLEENEAAREIAERELAEAHLELRLAELELERAEQSLTERTIKSPVSGWVIARMLNPGEYVHQESQIVSIAALDPLYVEAFIPVEHYTRLSPGQTAEIYPAPPIGGRYDAEISVVDRVFDASSSTFGVRMILENPENSLPAGQRCEVEFPTVSK